jgi:hypothetical protein
VLYPSNGADLKGLMKAAYLDPNPVLVLEHKGLYWSKIPGTENAKTIEPDENYILPIGKACKVIEAEEKHEKSGESVGNYNLWSWSILVLGSIKIFCWKNRDIRLKNLVSPG